MKTTPKKKSSPARGFTLIELLTVIAIVGILAAILIPVVSSMRAKARQSQSVNNLRELHAACTVYANDNKLRLPNAFIAANKDTGREQSAWWHQLVDGGYLGEAGTHPRQFKVLGSPVQWNQVPDITIDRNPPVYCTYGMNVPLSMLRENETKGIAATNLYNPSKTLYISEGYLAPGNTWFAVGVSPWGAKPNNTDGTIRYVYVDGHVEQVAEQDFPTTTGKRGSDEWRFWYGIE